MHKKLCTNAHFYGQGIEIAGLLIRD